MRSSPPQRDPEPELLSEASSSFRYPVAGGGRPAFGRRLGTRAGCGCGPCGGEADAGIQVADRPRCIALVGAPGAGQPVPHGTPTFLSRWFTLPSDSHSTINSNSARGADEPLATDTFLDASRVKAKHIPHEAVGPLVSVWMGGARSTSRRLAQPVAASLMPPFVARRFAWLRYAWLPPSSRESSWQRSCSRPCPQPLPRLLGSAAAAR